FIARPPSTTRVPYTTLFRSQVLAGSGWLACPGRVAGSQHGQAGRAVQAQARAQRIVLRYQRKLDRRALLEINLNLWGIPCRYRRSEEHTSELQSRENLVCRL